MKIENNNIVISFAEMMDNAKEEDIKSLFELGIMDGHFHNLIDDLIIGEIFNESYKTSTECKFGGIERDTLNDLRKHIVSRLSGLEKRSYDFEHDMYVKSQNKLGLSEDENYKLKRKVESLKSESNKKDIVISVMREELKEEVTLLKEELSMAHDEIMCVQEKYVAPIDIENIKLKAENEKFRKELTNLINVSEVNLDEWLKDGLIECRGDEDCDHCNQLSVTHCAKEALEELK